MKRCRVCNCTDDYCQPCIAFTGKPCRWVGPSLCSACEPVKPKGRWPKGGLIWVWRLLRGCLVYKVVRKLYHFARGNPRFWDRDKWLGTQHVAVWSMRWYVGPKSGLEALRKRKLIVPNGTNTGYWNKPDAYGYSLSAKAKEIASGRPARRNRQ